MADLTAELRSVNESLWTIEDEIRACERDGDFGPKFIELARSVYKANDRRATLKRQINVQLGSGLIEEKVVRRRRPDPAVTAPSEGGRSFDWSTSLPRVLSR